MSILFCLNDISFIFIFIFFYNNNNNNNGCFKHFKNIFFIKLNIISINLN